MPDHARASTRLMRRRARQVLRTYSNGELWRLLPAVERFGQTAVFGGLLRDMALDVPSTFSSDVDLVVDTPHHAELGGFLKSIGARENRHGGFRLDLVRGQLDVWPLALTWAFRRQLVRSPAFQSLPRTTFFTWDSVVYVPSTRALYTTDGFRRAVRTMTVDVELVDNPYPLGAAVRALRILLSGRAGLSPGLAIYLQHLLESFNNDEVLAAEVSGFARRYLDAPTLDATRLRLAEHVTHRSIAPLRIEQQLSLPFGAAVPIGDALSKWRFDGGVASSG